MLHKLTLPIGPIRPSPPKIKFFGFIWVQRPWMHMPKIDFHAKFGRPNQLLLPATELSAVKSNTIFLHGFVWQTKNLTPKISFWLKVDKKKTLTKNMSYDQSYAQKTNFSHFSFFFQFWVSLLSISIIQHFCKTTRHCAFLGGARPKQLILLWIGIVCSRAQHSR